MNASPSTTQATTLASYRYQRELDCDMPADVVSRWRAWEARQRSNGVDARILEAAVALIRTEKLSDPISTLSEFAQATMAVRKGVSGALLLEARRYVDAFGWPTGCKFVRGSHGGDYRPDPLGHDVAPYSIAGVHRPSIVEIAGGLRDRPDRGDAEP